MLEKRQGNETIIIGEIANLKPLWRILKELKLNPPHDTAILLLGIIPKNQTSYYQSSCSVMFIAVVFLITRNGNHINVLQLMNEQ